MKSLKHPVFVLFAIYILIASSCNKGSDSTFADTYDILARNEAYMLRMTASGQKIARFSYADDAIMHAIELAGESGGSIHIGPGVFFFHSAVKLDHQIVISGEGVNTKILPVDNYTDTCLFYGDSLNEVTLTNMKLTAAESEESQLSGIIIKNSGSCLFRDLTLIGFSERGIWLTEDTFLSEVRGCRFADIGRSGVFLDQLNDIGRAGPYLPNLVSNCIFFRGGKGVECSDAIVANIVACMVFQSREPAFHINSASNSILISGCRTFQIEDDAVVVEDSHEIAITGNIFCWQIKNGIVLKGVDWGTISGNNIIDSGNIPFEFEGDEEWEYWQERPESTEEYQYCGLKIHSDSKGLTINGNAIFNWASNPPMTYGIYESEDCSDNIVIGNNINYFTETGIHALGNGTIVTDNIATSAAHRGNKESIHSFDTRLIEKFIEEIK